jgi:regulator of RNase E activity RraA
VDNIPKDEEDCIMKLIVETMRKQPIISGFAMLLVIAVGGSVHAQRAAQPSVGPLIAGFRTVEVPSVADAIEQLYGTKSYMYHDMRPLFKTKFAGPAVTVFLKKEEHREGAPASQAMIDAIDTAPAGAVYVLVTEDGLDYGTVGGLMVTAMKYRGLAGAVVDGGIRDLPQIQRVQFPIYSRGVSPGTTIGHYRASFNVPVTCAGVKVNPNDFISADEDGVVVIPREKAAEILKKAQELDYNEHVTATWIEKLKSLSQAVAKLGRI